MRFRLEDFPPAVRARIEAKLAESRKDAPERAAQPSSMDDCQNDEDARNGHAVAGKRSAAKGRGPNATESEFNERFLGGNGLYEALCFVLPGGSRYTPDWVVLGNPIRVYEVKGAYRFPSEGRALVAFKAAQEIFGSTGAVEFQWWRKGRGGEWQKSFDEFS